MTIRILLILILTITTTLSCHPAPANSAWVKPLQPPVSKILTSVVATPDNPNRVFLASQNVLLEKEENGSWKLLWETSSEKDNILSLLHFKNLKGYLFILTQGSLYTYHFQTQSFSKIFHSINKNEDRVLSFAVHPFNDQLWLLGTSHGLFKTTNQAKTWSKVFALGEKPVHAITFIRNRSLFVQSNQLIFSDNFETFKTVYSFKTKEVDLSPDEDEDSLITSFPTYRFTTDSDSKIWLGTSTGVLKSLDGGNNWSWLPDSGLQKITVNRLLFSQRLNHLYASTKSGVYLFSEKNNHWQHLYEGFHGNIADISFLTNPHPTLVSITPTEYFEYSFLPPEVSKKNSEMLNINFMQLFYQLLKVEPTAIEIQKKVIAYNDVSNHKIKRWQLASRLKSLFPTFSFGKDFSRGNNIDLDRASTSVPDEYIFGPDDESEGWDISLGWDFSEAIWSSAQTSVDSRAKLMIDQRRDLLSEALRIYFERRRLQMQIISLTAESEMEHFNNLIRMDELTALLDSLTDGFMSEKLVEIYGKRPEFEGLWVYRGSNTDLLHGSSAEPGYEKI